MSSQIALVANEPVRGPEARVQHSERARRVDILEVNDRLVAPAKQSAPAAEKDAPELKKAVESLRNFVADVQRELQFSVDEDSGRTIITVIDSDSGKIIRQIPPEDLLQIAKSLADSGDMNLIKSRA